MADYTPGQPLEDILASIKKVITSGPQVSPAVWEHAPAAIGAESPDEVLELGEPVAPPSPVRASEPPAAAMSDEPLISDTVEEISRQALAALSSVSIDPGAEPNTLDGMVRELLRPMLKQWLDQNLPGIVERLVAREVARLGGR